MLRTALFRVFCGLLFVMGACTTFHALKSPSASYHRYVDRHLKIERIFDRGRELLVVKVLPVTQALRTEQRAVTPVASIPVKEDVRQVVLAVNVGGREPAILTSWELQLGGRKALSFSEITEDEVIAQEYYFAHPFYRVFIVNFPKPAAPEPNEEDFEVLSPYGRLTVKCDFTEH